MAVRVRLPSQGECSVCGRVFEFERTPKGTKIRKTCSKECLTENRRRVALESNVAKRPEVRKKISEAKKGKPFAAGSRYETPRKPRPVSLCKICGTPFKQERWFHPGTNTSHGFTHRKTCSLECLRIAHVLRGKRDGGPNAHGRFVIPEGGPCAGHKCDACSLCVHGRCCRGDNPTYTLPEEGSWPGGYFGRLGVFETSDDGELAFCHICNKGFKHVFMHAWISHDVNAAEYKAYFGLKRSRGLVSPKRHEQWSAWSKANLSVEPPSMTPEQQSYYSSGRKQRTEVLLAYSGPRDKEAWAKKIQRTRLANQRGAGVPCIICGALFVTVAGQSQKKTCSPECRHEAYRRNGAKSQRVQRQSVEV